MQAMQRSAASSTRGCARPSIAAGARRPAQIAFRPGQQPQFQQRAQRPRGVVCQGLFGLGLPEIAVIAGIAALVFGPSKLPELGKGLGQTVKSFQTAAKEFESELKAAAKDDDAPAAPSTEEAKKDVPANKP